MRKFSEYCTKVKIVGAEVASTVVFLIALYAAVKYEIAHLLK